MSDDYIARLAQKRVETQGNKAAAEKLISYIMSNPGVQHEDLVRKALELGHDPRNLIAQALGTIKIDKAGVSLDRPLEDILNEVYSDDTTPGKRYVIDPNNVQTPTGKKVAKELGDMYGVATGYRDNKGLITPDYYAIQDAKDEMGKIMRVPTGGHELRHGKDYLSTPDFEPTENRAYRSGHHYGDVYETSELIREARDLPENKTMLDRVKKAASNLNLPAPGAFKKIAGIAPILGKVGLATAGGMVSLASEAADSEIGGDAEGQAQFDRESDEYNRRKRAMEQSTPEQKNALSSVYNNLDSPQTDARLEALKKIRSGQ